MARTGRPPKYTIELRDAIARTLSSGCTRRAACGVNGISEECFHTWMRRHFDFCEAVTRAEENVEVLCTARIIKATEEDWKAAESWLRHRRKADWHTRIEQDVTTGGQPLRIVLDLGDSLPGTEADEPDSAEE